MHRELTHTTGPKHPIGHGIGWAGRELLHAGEATVAHSHLPFVHHPAAPPHLAAPPPPPKIGKYGPVRAGWKPPPTPPKFKPMTGMDKADFMNRTWAMAQAKQAYLDKIEPPRKHGLAGLWQDVQTGRGALGVLTTGGPAAFLARPNARAALFHGHFGKALSDAFHLGKYQPGELGPSAITGKKQKTSVMGIPLEGHFSDLWAVSKNALTDLNSLPSGFVDMAHMLGNSMIYDATHPPKGKPGLGHALWFAKDSQTSKTFQQLGLGTYQQFHDLAVHPERSLEQHPVNTVMNAAIVLGPIARLGGVAMLARSIAAENEIGATSALRAATTESFHPGKIALPTEQYPQGLAGGFDRRGVISEWNPEGVPFRSSRSPFGRFMQSSYDAVANQLPESNVLSMARKSRRAEAKQMELHRARVGAPAHQASRAHALYVNHGLIKKGLAVTGDVLRRGRDDAVGLALQGAAHEDPIEAVRQGVADLERILTPDATGRSTRVAQRGNAGGILDEDLLPGQQVYYKGEPVRVVNHYETTNKRGEPVRRVVIEDMQGNIIERAGKEPGYRDHLLSLTGPNGERVQIPHPQHEVDALTQTHADLSAALKELETDPAQLARFEHSVHENTNLAYLNEQAGLRNAIVRGLAEEDMPGFLEGGRWRTNLMARRWRRRGFRAPPPSEVFDNPVRTQLIDESTQRFGQEYGQYVGRLADDMAKSAVERGTMGDPEAWWQRIHSVVSSRAEEFIAGLHDPESAFYQEGIKLGEEARARRPERVAFNDHHKQTISDLNAAEKKWDATKKKYPEKTKSGKVIKENKAIRDEVAAELANAREVELWDRLFYGSKAYRDGPNFERTPARARVAAHLYRHRGDRNGALPPGVKSPADLERLTAVLRELADKGAHGRFWYRDSGRAIARLTGGDKELGARFAQLIAIYSPQKAVVPNLGEAIKAWSSHKAGLPIENGLDWQKVAAQKVLDGEGDWVGRKTNNFYRNLLQHIDYKRFVKEGFTGKEVTSDMWMARVFGYLRKEVSQGRYDVIEEVTRQLAKEMGWEPQEVQAAVWTAVKDISDDVSANTDFAGAIDRHIAGINYEAAPGSSLPDGHWFKNEYASWSSPTQAAFTRSFGNLTDRFMRRAGMLHYPSRVGPGVYEGEVSPGLELRTVTAGAARPLGKKERTAQIAAAQEAGVEPPPEIQPYTVRDSEKPVLRYIAASIGRAGLQNSVPWLRGFLPTSIGHADTIFVELGRRATPDEALALYHKLNPDPANERVWVIHNGADGITLRRNPFVGDGFPTFSRGKAYEQSFQGQVENAVASTIKGDPQLKGFVADGELLENDWRNGDAAYTQTIEDSLSHLGGSTEGVRLRELTDWFAGEAERLRRNFAADPTGATERFYGRAASTGRRVAGDLADAQEARGPPLFQPGIQVDALPRGATELLQGTMHNPELVNMHFFEGADPSTAPHELMHVALHDLTPRDFRTIVRELDLPRDKSKWTRDDFEKVTHAWDYYISTHRAPTPELRSVLDHLTQLTKATHRVTAEALARHGVDVSPAVRDVFERMITPRSVDDARAFFPHRSKYEMQLQEHLGGVRLPAGGVTIGRPKIDAQAFPRGENAQVLWESGELNLSPRALISQYLARQKWAESYSVRKRLFNEAHPIKGPTSIPDGAFLVRSPLDPAERITARTRAATTLDDESFRKLTGDISGGDWSDTLPEWLVRKKDEGSTPWVGNYENVRWIEPEKVTTLIQQVFPSAPRGRGAAALGSVNAMTRMSQIYLRPIRYITGNLPANVVIAAFTHPSALGRSLRPLAASIRNAAGDFGKGPAELARNYPHLYERIKGEGGDIMAGAGLPDFYTQANNLFQGAERRLNRWSGEMTDRLGEVADEPFRVAVWQTWAKQYGFHTPADYERLLDGVGPDGNANAAVARVRDEIAQRTREDMIDFNTLTPWERQHISRFFYLWAFTRGFIKWPFTFAREYPERAGIITSLAASAHDRGRPYPGSWNDPRLQAMINAGQGRSWDISSWAPETGGIDALNTLNSIIHGQFGPAANYLSPALQQGGQQLFDPYGQHGWGYIGNWLAGNVVPPIGQAALGQAGVMTPAGSKAAQPNAITDLMGKVPVIGGVLKAQDPYLTEFGRFARPRYTPGNWRKYLKDWNDRGKDWTLNTSGVSGPELQSSIKDYWRYKEYESRVKRGIVARTGRTKLSPKEEATLLAAVANESDRTFGYIPTADEIQSATDTNMINTFISNMNKMMFGPREKVQSGATRVRNERKKTQSVTR